MLSMLIDMHMLLAPLVLILQMHTDMGDERGIRLRCICLGRAALRGSRMRGMGLCSKGSASRIARSSLSIARFSKQSIRWLIIAPVRRFSVRRLRQSSSITRVALARALDDDR